MGWVKQRVLFLGVEFARLVIVAADVVLYDADASRVGCVGAAVAAARTGNFVTICVGG